MRRFLPIVALLLSSVLWAAPARADIRIALVGPMTGPEAAFGEQMKHGAELAVAELNDKGGLNNQKIVLDVEDDACDPKQAVNVANRIVAQGIKYVIGHWCTGATLAAAPIYAEEGVLELDPAGLLPETTQKGYTTMFRLSSVADYWGKIVADYAMRNAPVTHAFVLADQRAVTDLFGKAIADELHNANNTIKIDTDTFNGGDRDFNSVVAKAKLAGADTIFVSGYTQETALIVRQAASLPVKFYSWDVMGSPDFPKVVGEEALKKSTYVDYSRPRDSADVQAIDKTLDAKGWPKETYTYMVYAAFQVLDQAWKQAPDGTVTKLADALHHNAYATIFGDMKFTPSGDRYPVSFTAYQWQESNSVAVQPAN